MFLNAGNTVRKHRVQFRLDAPLNRHCFGDLDSEGEPRRDAGKPPRRRPLMNDRSYVYAREFLGERLNREREGNAPRVYVCTEKRESVSQSRFYEILRGVNKTVIMTISIYESRAVI